jgi:predicted sulfurtransferase
VLSETINGTVNDDILKFYWLGYNDARNELQEKLNKFKNVVYPDMETLRQFWEIIRNEN